MAFNITHKDKKTNARVGILQTKSGAIETPFFMPVATKATTKFINSQQLEEMKIKAVISNAFILSLRPGKEVIKKVGDLGKFMNFSGVNFTDSGGFQMYSEYLYLKSDDSGVWFKNPISGETIFMTPEKNMDIQLDIGADVAMCLDTMPLYGQSKKDILQAVERTVAWAERCKKEHDRLQKKVPQKRRQLLFSISQGGIYSDLRKHCVEQLLKYDFDGFAIGGVALPEQLYGGNIEDVKKQEQEIIRVHKKIVPENKICYLMGEGDPLWMLDAIALGVDCFDSRFPTQSARRGSLLTWQGKLKILNKQYTFDQKPIDKNCKCFACKNYTRSYIRHLLKEDEAVGKELTNYHNLFFMNELIEKAKEAIKKKKFSVFKNKIEKIFSKK